MRENADRVDERQFALAVKAIITDNRDRCLIIRRSGQSRAARAEWELPGGKVMPGEDFAAALVRKVKQECGLDVVPTRLVGALQTETPDRHFVRLMLAVRVAAGTVELSEEHDCFEWVPLAELGLPCADCRLLASNTADRDHPWRVVWRSCVP